MNILRAASAALLFLATAVAQTAAISDIISTPFDGELFSGTIDVSLNSPARAQPLYSGSVTLAGWTKRLTVTAGVVQVALYTNTGITPAGTSYSAVYTTPRGEKWAETWVVEEGDTKVRDIRSTTVPTPPTSLLPSQISHTGATNGQVFLISAGLPAWATLTTAQIGEGTNLWFTEARARAAISAIGGLTYNATTGQVACPTCVLTSGLFSDPSFIESLAYAKLIGRPMIALSGLHKGDGAGGAAAAVAGVDYAPALPLAGVLKGNGMGGAAAATPGADYAPAIPGSSMLKGAGNGAATGATEGADYIGPATLARVSTYAEAQALATGSAMKLIVVQSSTQFNSYTVLYLYDGAGHLWQTAAVQVP